MISPWSEPGYADLADLVARRTGLVFAPHRCESLEQAVRHVMKQQGLTLAELERRLATGTLSWDPLIAQMTVGETYFFRDSQHFDFIGARLLPELMERRGSSYRPRLWSAGCATGEEAYSLAIALEEYGKLEGAFVLGTDLSQAALSRARAGRYTKWSLRGLDPRLLAKYFRRVNAEVVLAPNIRDSVSFEELNLAGFAYPSPITSTFSMDLVLCRNVLIYFGPSTIASVAQRFFESLAPGGYLITGPSDPLLTGAGFEIAQTAHGTQYRRPLEGEAQRNEPRYSLLPPLPLSVRSPPPPRPSPPAPPPTPIEQIVDWRERAHLAGREADLGLLEQLCARHPAEEWLSVLTVRVATNASPPESALAQCHAALERHPLSAELHYLNGLTLLALSQPGQAAEALRRAIYLDPSLAIVHFTLGTVLGSLQDNEGAERAYRNAEQCTQALRGDQPVPMAAEIAAKGLASAARRELVLLRNRSAAR